MKIGFIGLGIMGKPMAKNLLKAGYELFVKDLNKDAVAEVVNAGAKESTNEEIGNVADLVLTMLPNSPQVKEVMLGENGLIKNLHKGQTYIDMSSINPLASKEVSEELAKVGVEMLDAPVSGGEPKAIDGTLAFMVGGKKNVFDEFKPVLEKMGSSVTYCGNIGAGNTTKLSNQVIVAANIAALAEGLMLARKAGVDPNTVFEAIKGGLAGSTVMNAKAPMMVANNVKPGFKINLHIKDLNNALEVGEKVGSPLPLTNMVMDMFKELREDGFGDSDHSALAKYYEKISNAKIYNE